MSDKIHTTDILWQGNVAPKFANTLRSLALPRKHIADELDISYKTYDNYVNGRTQFPPHLIRPLLDIVNEDDQEMIFAAIIPEGFEVLPKRSVSRMSDMTPNAAQARMNEITENFGRAVGVTSRALADGRDLTSRTCRSMARGWRTLIRNLFEFDVQIKIMCRRRVKGA